MDTLVFLRECQGFLPYPNISWEGWSCLEERFNLNQTEVRKDFPGAAITLTESNVTLGSLKVKPPQ